MCSLSRLHNAATSAHDHLSKLEAQHEGAVQAAAGNGTSSQKISLEPADNLGDPDGPRVECCSEGPPNGELHLTTSFALHMWSSTLWLSKQRLETASGCDVSSQDLTREANIKHEELTQGPSGNENWHSWVRRTIQTPGGICGLFTIHMYLEW
jgi:hypothetical protein